LLYKHGHDIDGRNSLNEAVYGFFAAVKHTYTFLFQALQHIAAAVEHMAVTMPRVAAAKMCRN